MALIHSIGPQCPRGVEPSRQVAPVTAIVTAFNRPTFLSRALASVRSQTLQPAEIIVANDGEPIDPPEGTRYLHTARADNMFLTWCDAVHKAHCPSVLILHDDDYLEPTFLERAVPLLDERTAYVFVEGQIHFSDGSTRLNWGGCWGPTCKLGSRTVGDAMATSTGIVTPSSVLYRRADVLRCLLPGDTPVVPRTQVTSGPDQVLALLPLLMYPLVAWIAEPQVHLDGGEQSTTIRELSGPDRGAALKHNYDNARWLYTVLRDAL